MLGWLSKEARIWRLRDKRLRSVRRTRAAPVSSRKIPTKFGAEKKLKAAISPEEKARRASETPEEFAKRKAIFEAKRRERWMPWWKRTSAVTLLATGAGVGAVALGAPMLPIAAGVAGLVGWRLYKRQNPFGAELTPERSRVYEQALHHLKDPAKLRSLADEFERCGCAAQAEHLRKRAALRERDPEDVRADRARYKAALRSKNPRHIEQEIDYFESIAADGTADNLRYRLQALRSLERG